MGTVKNVKTLYFIFILCSLNNDSYINGYGCEHANGILVSMRSSRWLSLPMTQSGADAHFRSDQ